MMVVLRDFFSNIIRAYECIREALVVRVNTYKMACIETVHAVIVQRYNT